MATRVVAALTHLLDADDVILLCSGIGINVDIVALIFMHYGWVLGQIANWNKLFIYFGKHVRRSMRASLMCKLNM